MCVCSVYDIIIRRARATRVCVVVIPVSWTWLGARRRHRRLLTAYIGLDELLRLPNRLAKTVFNRRRRLQATVFLYNVQYVLYRIGNGCARERFDARTLRDTMLRRRFYKMSDLWTLFRMPNDRQIRRYVT